MPFFQKPAPGPDAVGGVWPFTTTAICRNRSSATLLKGQAVQLALGAGNHQATEIATNDANSYDPGASNDTVWNTVVDPRSNTVTNGLSGLFNGAVIGVALADVADNAVGEFGFFGIFDALLKESSGSDGAQPSQVLTVTSTNHFDCHVGTNKLIVAFYLQSNDATIGNTTAKMKQIFLTNGMFMVSNGAQAVGIART
jgi:hypothetical protein